MKNGNIYGIMISRGDIMLKIKSGDIKVFSFGTSKIEYFSETYQYFIDNSQKRIHNIYMDTISMGMSDSYAVAIEEGATLVRVGRKLFNRI